MYARAALLLIMAAMLVAFFGTVYHVDAARITVNAHATAERNRVDAERRALWPDCSELRGTINQSCEFRK